MNFSEEMRNAASMCGLQLTEEQYGQFARYYELLMEWNEKMNLTAITDPREVAVKHMIDSLTACQTDFFPDISQKQLRLIDVGTGAGFPGLPIKIFCPSIRLVLLDSLGKRVKFLETVVAELGLKDVQCIHARAEEGARDKALREQFDIAVSRAVARLPILAEYCLPFVRTGGVFLALKGMQYREEAAEAEKAAAILGGGSIEACPVTLPGLDDVRAVLCIPKRKKTPKTYPRKAGTPVKKPLGRKEENDGGTERLP